MSVVIDALLITTAKRALEEKERPPSLSLHVLDLSAPYDFLRLLAFDGRDGGVLSERFRVNKQLSFGGRDYALIADLTVECGGTGTFVVEPRTAPS